MRVAISLNPRAPALGTTARFLVQNPRASFDFSQGPQQQQLFWLISRCVAVIPDDGWLECRRLLAMGIQGLLPILKDIQTVKHLREFKGKTLAVGTPVSTC
jgi:hypothetical protein